MKTLNKKDQAILNCIIRKPRILIAEISDEIAKKENIVIPYPTVQRRVQQMANTILHRGFVVDYAKAGYVFRYKISIWVDHVDLKEVANSPQQKQDEKDLSVDEQREQIYRQHMSVRGDYEEENHEANLQIRLANYIRTILAEQDRFKDKLVVSDVFVLLGGGYGDMEALLYSRHDRICMEFIINGLRNLKGIKDTGSAKLGFSSRYGWLGENHEGEK
jgi:DNA-binding Lrp family transcriptional regulator